jgi:hypothetical protein
MFLQEVVMAFRTASSDYPTRILFGFTAGFFATLTFHQLSLLVLWAVGLAPFAPYSMAAAKPSGIPHVISLALWGGVWGILFALIHRRFPAHSGYWIAAFLFGAVFTSLVGLLVVFPLKGQPVGGGWHASLLLTEFIINGVWGIGLGFFLEILSCPFSRRHVTA